MIGENMKQLFALSRNNATATFRIEPWNFVSRVPDEIRKDKNARTRWANAFDTRHCFYSGFEGLNPALRVNKDNPVAKMLAIVADYDRANMDLEEAIKLVVNFEDNEFVPNYMGSTLSGGVRLVWILEESLNLNTEMAKKFMRHIRKVLNLHKLLPGLDEPALYDPSKYYEAGENWKQLNSNPIPNANGFLWMQKSVHKIKICETLEDEIPLERVQSELESNFPDVKFPKLEPGIRMHRFWDPSATNESAAFLMPGGFYCHTGDEGFVGWTELLGRTFMREFEVAKTGIVIDEFWYDSKEYISRNPRMDGWLIQKTPEAVLNIAARFGLSKAAPKKGELSPIERILHEIQLVKQVKAYAKFVHMPEGEMQFLGEKYINTSRVRALPPSGTSGAWGEHFPFLAEFLDGLLVTETQRDVMLAWWKVFYTGALAQKPKRGQILIIAGPPACGKTLFSTQMLGPSVGGYIDAADFYINGGDFGDKYYEYGLQTVDDGEPGRRIDAQKAMAARYKKTAASQTLSVNGKFQAIKQIAWLGRVCTTMNDDPESLKTMPELQATLEDKIIVLRARKPNELLERTDNIESLIRHELPHLLQWLVDWDIPENVKGGRRYGVISYCDNKLREEMESGSSDQMFLELLSAFLKEVKIESGDGPLEVRTTELVSRMRECETIRLLMNEYKPVHVGHILARFSAKDYGFISKRKAFGTYWTIEHEFIPEEK